MEPTVVFVLVFVVVSVLSIWVGHIQRKRDECLWKPSKNPPKPILENTQKVQPRTQIKSTGRSVIRNTQFRGRSRKKF